MPEARLHDGSTIELETHGDGPALLLPVNPRPVEGTQAEQMRKWGTDPALGRSLIDGLSDAFRVIAFDYEGHILAEPKPDTLTPAAVANDMLAVADAAGVERFGYYGYSWLALTGLQLAIRTDRLSALAMGGFPPIGGPYAEMLRVTTATSELAVPAGTDPKPGPRPDAQDWSEYDWSTVEVTMTEPQTRQFVTLYEALQDFDDVAAQARVDCPRLCFVGSADEIHYGERWGNVTVRMAEPITNRRTELEHLGWTVHILEGLDHMRAMQADRVLPILRPWLATALSGG
ncbi:alpha/beta fold hydrolase [Amycolatopsis cihanbeyliensis]|uniref:Pimeloyl-ACP methyl ester carboxylesterase n=1 Tax=Amycolatopsis cihanbeyliensis TaxID=1128664 RepID=A0A542DRX7_AMYCI|nr:alpha/beta hydrolase [Amycolatopsis cihanbeyliensis]TQJ05867.1 pimeloyl-ACP methyl ester carboxylesterase [Amycolatopsis cihanbeyliensis]